MESAFYADSTYSPDIETKAQSDDYFSKSKRTKSSFSNISDNPLHPRPPRSIEKRFAASRNIPIPHTQLKTGLIGLPLRRSQGFRVFLPFLKGKRSAFFRFRGRDNQFQDRLNDH